MTDRATFAGDLELVLDKHRLGPAVTKPWYMQEGASRMPKNYKAVYRCKCRGWEGEHGDHAKHVAERLTDRIAAVLECRELIANPSQTDRTVRSPCESGANPPDPTRPDAISDRPDSIRKPFPSPTDTREGEGQC